MRLSRLVARAAVLAAVAAPALPGIATTTTTTGVALRTVATVQTVAAGTAHTVAVPLRSHDRLVGVTWTSGVREVAVRWQLASGWTPWSALDNDASTPTANERAGARPGTEPAWRPDGALRADLRIAAGSTAADAVRIVVVGDLVHRVLAGVHPTRRSAEAATGKAALGHVYTR